MTGRFRCFVVAVLVAAFGAGCGPASSEAEAAIRVGIGEQDPRIFTNPFFSDLRVKRARVFPPWNVALRRRDRRLLDAWMDAARAAGVEPLVSFNPSTGSRCPRRPCRLPSVRQYTRAFVAFRRRYPFVRVINPWNEANHRSQPTFRRPRRAAQYYNAVRRRCRGCTIIAADVIDEVNMVRWLRVFKRYARRPRIWGLHNYRDTNPRRGQIFGGTRRLLRTVRGQVWLLETGGIVRFVLPNGGTLFPTSERRANAAVKRMFRLARRYRRRIRRLYIYNWIQPAGSNRFDAGLLRRNGTPRAAYFTVKRHLATRDFDP
jgi:hypothetical protein